MSSDHQLISAREPTRRELPTPPGDFPDPSPPPLLARLGALGRAWNSLGWRLVLFLTLILLGLLGATGWFALQLHRGHLVGFLEGNVANMGETILWGTHASMLENDQRHLSQIVESVGQREGVLALRIFDSAGLVRHSSVPEELGRAGDLTAPTCRGCHSGEGPALAPSSPRDGLRLYRDPKGRGTMGMVVPILNTPECSNAACHVHREEQQVLGVLDLEVSTAGLDHAMSAARTQMLIVLLITALAAPTAVGIVSWRMVHRPLRRLSGGIRRVERGELGHRVSTGAACEMGELAGAFNDMSDRLERADRTLRDWNETLERRIEEKTLELERTRDRIVVAEKMASLGKLAAIVAHEINNPLAGILVYAKLARRKLPTLRCAPESSPEAEAQSQTRIAEINDMLATIERETARCGDIARNLLAMSRQGSTTYGPESLNEIVERSIRLTRHQAEIQEIDVRLEFASDLSSFTCNAGEIQQAVTVLVMNAIEAMPSGGRLTVRTHACGRGVRLEVQDTGPGIPEPLRTKIFEPFYTTKTGGSTGLGLAVLYGIVRRHSGQIDFDTSPTGTTFWMDLPGIPPGIDGTGPDTEGDLTPSLSDGDLGIARRER